MADAAHFHAEDRVDRAYDLRAAMSDAEAFAKYVDGLKAKG